MQRTVGNRIVLRILEAGVQPRTTRSLTGSTLTKTLGQEEELAKRMSPMSPADVLTKTLGQEEELAKSRSLAPTAAPLPEGDDRLHKAVIGEHGTGCGCALCASSPEVQRVALPGNGRVSGGTGPAPTKGGQQNATANVPGSIAREVAVDVAQVGLDEPQAIGSRRGVMTHQASALLAKASIAVQDGAAASNGLGGGVYGLTFPESVDVDITAKLDKGAGTWSPKVTKLTGHYSMQTRLLPGQSEITGPSGNTTDTNFCDQCTNLKSIGNTVGNTWYMISAVVKHEKVHAKRFKPGLTNARTAIVTAVEATTVPDVAGMTKTQAVTQLQADATFQAAVTNAQALWLAEILTLVAGDHAAGGPTDKAEQTLTEPMRKKICRHAKKQKWGACAACP